MESTHPLKALLQLQLATDSSAVLHLPYILSSLTSDCFLPSSHLTKWTTQINSLLYSKDAGGRWAGLCIAQKTADLSREIMIEYAQSWLGVALPMLSKNEPAPTIKAAIRLLRMIFSTGLAIPEFQRQIATPNVPKFTAALVILVDKNADEELQILILKTLARLVPLYPTLNRASHPALSALSLRFLNGSVPNPTSEALLEAASQLYSALPFTGGKVGAANLWRKAVDETLTFGWGAFFALRTTFPEEGRNASYQPTTPAGEPQMAVPLNLDRLRCCIVVLGELLSSTTHRPIQLPLGSLVKFATTLLGCTTDDKYTGHHDVTIRAMETSVIPNIWKLSCDLISCLAKSARHHLTPNLTRLVSYLTFHLEQKRTPSQRLFLLTTLQTLFTHCHLLDSLLIPTRLAKAVLPSLSVILATPTESEDTTSTAAGSTRSKKGKKRARGYEGDEVFKLSRSVICPSLDDGKVLIAAFEVMQILMRNHNLSPAIQSISSRVLISVLLTLPQMSPASLSGDLTLHKRLLQLVHTMSTELGSGTTSVMSKSLGLVIRTTITDENHDSTLRNLDILLHPRVPPLVRSLPHVESLSLFRAEEPQEEIEAREALSLETTYPDQPLSTQDVAMKDGTSTPASQPRSEVQAPPPTRTPVLPAPTPQPASFTPVSLSGQKSTIQHGPSNFPPPTSEPPFSNPAQPSTITPRPPSPLPVPAVVPVDEEEDEEMPPIDLDSDSDADL